ncbi:hypothetical protein COF68_04870 [Bacillus toyonensis]|uniref:DUF3994 domain-containing protein n=1 Tax=Bacillus toyonensis TaxID=155322 RepID=UPI000BFD6496|nr:DUF3994 domain-containing protein [Bacillus toyonensis]PHE64465.1 hypothetical protein COF68_04870 [Bacillus toyonensis]
MKAKKLVTLAVPFMLLVGCGTDKTEAKPKEKVESKSETKEKLTKETYPQRMSDLSSELMKQVLKMTDLAKDPTKDTETIEKNFLKEEPNLQKVIAKFDKVEPPKEYKDSHKDLVKAVDCYSKAYKLQAEIIESGSKNTEKNREKSEEFKKLINQGVELWKTGSEPIQNAIKGKDTVTSSSETPKSNEDIKISFDGKELIGEWGNYKEGVFRTGLTLKEDGTYSMYDDSGKSSYEENHMTGTWYYSDRKKEITFIPKEFVKDGKTIEQKNMEVAVDYRVEEFNDNKLKIVDTKKGNTVTAERRK